MQGATEINAVLSAFQIVSIHAPYAGSDPELRAEDIEVKSVSIHAPYAGSDIVYDVDKPFADEFQSTPPMQGATKRFWIIATGGGSFNPRPLCRERPGRSVLCHRMRPVSIHAPYAGSDELAQAYQKAKTEFQSTPPMQGATGRGGDHKR